jgi:glycosyltransferase involved in cell wall biosynthesis
MKNLKNNHLYIPENEHTNPIEVSVVIPALNEELSIAEFIEWCNIGLKNVHAEIIIIDSSTDQTPFLALKNGARVLRIPKKGLGNAYIKAIPYIRGKYVILGDCDLTYDFKDLKLFLKGFHDGYEFILGSRFKGKIEKNSMPILHRYFGNPITTLFLNIIYGTKFSDIHCGMRGVTKKALKKMKIKSQSWEYASEMVLKSKLLNLKTLEIPVNFYKEKDGRVSHHKRAGLLSPWLAGWINLKVMMVFNPSFFTNKLGILFISIGLIFSLLSYFDYIYIFSIGLSTNFHFFSFFIIIIGLLFIQLGISSKIIFERSLNIKYKSLSFSYNFGIGIFVFLFLIGVTFMYTFFESYIHNDYIAVDNIHELIFGLTVFVIDLSFFINLMINELRKNYD